MSFRQRSVTYVKSFLRAFTREKRYPTCFKFRFVSSPQEENGVLVLDVYSVNVPSDVIHEKGFALWAKALKGGEQSSHEYVAVIHALYRLGGAVNIDRHYRTGEG